MAFLYFVIKNHKNEFYNNNAQIKSGKLFYMYIFTNKSPTFAEIKIETPKEIFTRVVELTKVCNDVPVIFRTITPGMQRCSFSVTLVDEYSEPSYQFKNDENINLIEFVDSEDKTTQSVLVTEKPWFANLPYLIKEDLNL